MDWDGDAEGVPTSGPPKTGSSDRTVPHTAQVISVPNSEPASPVTTDRPEDGRHDNDDAGDEHEEDEQDNDDVDLLDGGDDWMLDLQRFAEGDALDTFMDAVDAMHDSTRGVKCCTGMHHDTFINTTSTFTSGTLIWNRD